MHSGISIRSIVFGVGALVLPPIVGTLVDSHGYASAVIFLGSAIFLAGLLLLLTSEPQSKQGTKSAEEVEERLNLAARDDSNTVL